MIRVLALAAVAMLWTAGAIAQDKAQQTAATVCAACHAPDGNGTAPANPKLAGQHPGYLYKQMMDFKAQGGKEPARKSPVMGAMVTALAPADMKGLADYFAGQAMRPSAAGDKALAALGQKLWRGGNAASGVPACAGCHGPTGAGIPAQYPRLGGQYAEYVGAQLKAFRDGTRANDPGGMMRAVAARLTDREIQAAAEYAAGLR